MLLVAPYVRPVTQTTDAAQQAEAARRAGPDSATASQADIDAEIAAAAQEYAEQSATSGTTEDSPRLDYAPYRSSLLRHPTKSPQQADPSRSSCSPRSSATTTWAPRSRT